jgi:hypothetical protein
VNKALEKWLDMWRVRLDAVPVHNFTTEDVPVQNVSEVVAPLLATVLALPPFIPMTWICSKCDAKKTIKHN